MSKDAGTEPMTVATLVLAVRRSNHLHRSQCHPQTRLDLIQFSASTFTMNFTHPTRKHLPMYLRMSDSVYVHFPSILY